MLAGSYEHKQTECKDKQTASGGLSHVAGAERPVRQRLAVRRGEARVLAHQHAALEQAVREVSPLRIPPLLHAPTGASVNVSKFEGTFPRSILEIIKTDQSV